MTAKFTLTPQLMEMADMCGNLENIEMHDEPVSALDANTIPLPAPIDPVAALDAKLIAEAYAKLDKAETDKTGAKPVQIYRQYVSFLREIIARKGLHAEDARMCLAELYLTQTRPDSELENPDWIDGYTHELIPVDAPFETEMDGQHGTLSGAGKLGSDNLVRRLTEVAADLHWDEKTLQTAIAAQTGFDAESDEPEVFGEDRPRTDILLPNDWVIDPNIWEHASIISDFNIERSLVFDQMKRDRSNAVQRANLAANDVPDGVDKRAWAREIHTGLMQVVGLDWHTDFRKRIAPAQKSFVNEVKELVKTFDAPTMVAFVGPMLGPYGISEKVLRGIKVIFNDANRMSLVKAINWVLPDLPLTDSLKKSYEPDPRNIDPDFMQDLAATCDPNSKNPIETPEYNLAKIEAISAGASLETANRAAWTAWKARKATIATIQGNKSGLILNTGRKISWAIAVLKLKHNELELTDNVKSRLAAKLAELGVKNEFTALLAQ